MYFDLDSSIQVIYNIMLLLYVFTIGKNNESRELSSPDELNNSDEAPDAVRSLLAGNRIGHQSLIGAVL